MRRACGLRSPDLATRWLVCWRHPGSGGLMRRIAAVVVGVLVSTGLAVPAEAGGCRQVRVPGAEYSETTCLQDLTTVGGRTNPADYAGLTHAAFPQPKPVSGTQVDGYFP